ncbi:Lazarillo protein [Gryllus bimaculatus]|nr:Lazarillo protein [Gryllus bimaculatus]
MAGNIMQLAVFAIVTILGGVSSHTYHLGTCPKVEAMDDFQMSKFLGIWYVVQKTSTGSSCLANNYTVDHESGGYLLEQTSQHLILGLTSLDHTYRYTGKLSVPRPNVPAKMQVNFPLSVAGSATYTVFATDYENYAGIFTCQKLTFAHRQSASILSRKRTLEKQYVDKLRNKLSSYGIDPFDLSIIDQSGCPTEEGVNINIDSNTFSAGSIAGVVRTAGDKLGDGIETLASGAKTVYHTVQNKRDREELSSGATSNEAEWLP